MTPTEFSTFKYQHPDRAVRSRKRLIFVGLSLAVALGIAVLAFPPGALALLVPLVAWFSVSKQLQLGPRYLLCGQSIVYYGNVTRLTLARAQGSLRVQSASGQVFVLERDKFPTGARKTAKIAANKAAKFDKVSGKIIDKVRQAGAQVELIGI